MTLGEFFQPSAFGSRFGIGIRRFEFILRCLSFGDMDPMDRWSPIRPFLAAINERRQQVIDPSYILVEDELMSSWISRKQDRTIDGIPHLTKIIRNPKGAGTEIKCLADGVVGIMLRLEICEGKEAESRKSDHTFQQGLHILFESVSPGMELGESQWPIQPFRL